MKLTLTLPDDLYDTLATSAKAVKLSPERLAAFLLDRFQTVTPQQRYVLLDGEALRAVEESLGGRSVESGPALAERLANRAGIELETYRLKLSPAQILSAKKRSEKLSLTFDEYLYDVCKRVGMQMEEQI